MKFRYYYTKKEANFGRPLKTQVDYGTHITFEIVLKKGNKFIALRRNSIPGHETPPHAKYYPKGLLYFCHNLIRFGETVEKCIKRIVKEQCGVNVKSFKLVEITSAFQKKDKQWAIIPHVIAEVDKIPKPGVYGNRIYEVITFDKRSVPADWAWWTKREIIDFIKKVD